MPYFLQNPAILILAPVTLITLILYVREYNLRRKTTPAGEKILEDTQQKGYQMLASAIKKAQAILSMAELEGIKLVAGSKVSVGKLDLEYAQKLNASIQASQTALNQDLDQTNKALTLAQQEFVKFLSDLKIQADKREGEVLTMAQQKINRLFDTLEQKLSQFLIATEQKTTSSIELEMKSARELIETYKNEQLKLIDENIIAILEQTLALVLSQKLSLKDQLDLIYEALEKAKVEKFII